MPRFIKPLIRSPRYCNRLFRSERWKDTRIYRRLFTNLGIDISYKKIIAIVKKVEDNQRNYFKYEMQGETIIPIAKRLKQQN